MQKILYRITSTFLAVVMVLSTTVCFILPTKASAQDDKLMYHNEILLDSLVKNRNFVITTLTEDYYPQDNPNAVINGIFDESQSSSSRDFHYVEILNELENLRAGFKILVNAKYLVNQAGDIGAQIIQEAFGLYRDLINKILVFFTDMDYAGLATLTTEQLCEALSVELTDENRSEYNDKSKAIRQIGAGIQYVENAVQNYQSPSENQYAAILNHALTKNYTSSIGNSTSYEQSDMEMLDSVENFLKLSFFTFEDIEIDGNPNNTITIDLPKITGTVKDAAKLINEGVMGQHADKYINQLFTNLIDTGESQLSRFSRMVQYDLENQGNHSKSAIQSQKAIQTILKNNEYEYLATEQAWRSKITDYTNAKTGEINKLEYEKYYNKYKDVNSFIESVDDISKVINSGLKIGKKTIENINYFETLYQNYTSMYGLLDRAKSLVQHNSIKNIQISEAIDSIICDMELSKDGENLVMLAMVDALTDVIVKNDENVSPTNLFTVNRYGSYIKKTITENATDAVALAAARCKNLSPIATRAALSNAVKRIGGAISMGILIGDIVFNISDIVDKYVELLYIKDVIELYKNLYHEDYNKYLTAKNNGVNAEERDALAKLVLEDLEFLKILKCRAESLSFDVDISALNCLGNKVFETIYCGVVEGDPSLAGQSKAKLEAQKKSHIDAIVDTLINPYCTPQITLTSGQWMNIKEVNGDIQLEIFNESSADKPVAVKAEGQYALRGYVSASNAKISLNGNVYIGTLSLKNSILYITGMTDTVGLYGLEMIGTSKIITVDNDCIPLVESSYASISGTADLSDTDFLVTENISLKNANITGKITNFGNYTGDGTSSISSLVIDGDVSTQYSGGTLNLEDLNIVNTAPRGICLENIEVNVSDMLENDNTYVVHGQMIHALSTAGFKEPYFHSDITLDNLSISEDMTFGGIVHTNGDIVFGGDEFICGGIVQESGTLTVTAPICTVNGSFTNTSSGAVTLDADAVMTVCGDMSFGSANAAMNGSVYLGGDMIANSNNVSINYLELNGQVIQKITNSNGTDYTLQINDLILSNKSHEGIQFSNNFTVKNSVYNPDTVTQNGERITLNAGALIIGDSFMGNLTLISAHITDDITINGDLVIKDGLNVENSTLTVCGNFDHVSGSLSVQSDSTLHIKGMILNHKLSSGTCVVAADGLLQVDNIANMSGYNTVTVDGDAIFACDLSVSGTVSGAGILYVGGDLNVTGTLNKPAQVVLTSSVAQTVNGGTLNFNDLTINNSSTYGIKFMTAANVYGNLINNANRIINEDYIIMK